MKTKEVNRRDFLRMSAAVGAGTLTFPTMAAATMRKKSVEQEGSKFPIRTLGRTGIRVPILSMGVMKAENPNVVRAAYNSGITFFDTAHGYQEGRNETMLGGFFKGKPRDSFTVATKGKFDYPLKDQFEEDFTALLDLSLKRLQMDYVDIFYTHALNSIEKVTDKRIITLLQKFKADGKIRHAGFSTHARKPELIDAGIEAGIYDVILLSYNFTLDNLKETDAAIERAAKAGIGIVAMKTMAGGVEDADGKRKINAQACLKWVWQNENVATVIPGFTNYDELEECVAAAGQPDLTPAEKEYLAMLCGKELLYCQQCGKCMEMCVEKLPVPDLMRAYMYAFGYKNASLSKETLLELNLPETVCSRCGKNCHVQCPSGFDVAKKIAAVRPVMNVPDVFLT
ncbi:MAG: aldo/keto reductase [Tannerella sp.]|jgi:predicted aldo/keto reductase-like oxidoreductase|nr:aldo/keto reductase [Tannerella sp.]